MGFQHIKTTEKHTNSVMSDTMYTNKLINESSLYLKQHAHNPVNWYPWSDEALQKAKDEQKIIFLSIGYSSCHWCHVMERESFEDKHVADYLNKHFISIKIDREERPDIDAIYMEAIQMMTGHGGWPLNVWLTPNLEPVFGGTYFPPESVHQRPGFMHVLMRLTEIYKNEPETVSQRAEEIRKALEQDIYDHIEAREVSLVTLQNATETCARYFDEQDGGFSTAPKFPSAMNIGFLMRYHKLTGDEKALQMGLHSLRKMCLGGIYDQIGGGFHRYSTDANWLVPHFEKMLYDNALLLSALADAHQITGEYIFEETIRDTINFIKGEMTSPSGGFFAAIDADSEGVEGKFYIWSHAEIEQIIPKEDFPLFAAYYGVYPQGNWEGSVILNRIHTSVDFCMFSQLNHDDFQEKNQNWKQILMDVRSERVNPALDTKIIASWNAMMLKALCKVWFAGPTDEILGLIQKNAQYLLDKHYIDGTVYRISYENEKSKILGFCDDYALLSEAFCHVFEVTGNDMWLDAAVQIAGTMNELFFDKQTNSFSFTRNQEKDVLVRKKDTFDNATPGANSAAIAALQRCGRLAGIGAFTSQAHECIEALGSVLADHGLSFGYLLQTASEVIARQKGEIVISGLKPDEFLAVTSQKFMPFHLIICVKNPELSTYSTISGKNPINGKTAVYVCNNFTCDKPVTKQDILIEKLNLMPKFS